MLNEKVGPVEAARIGLVARAVPARGAAFEAAVAELAAGLAAAPQLALRRIKASREGTRGLVPRPYRLDA